MTSRKSLCCNAMILEVIGRGRRSPPAVTALARTESPNSIAATKLFPYLPYRCRITLLAEARSTPWSARW